MAVVHEEGPEGRGEQGPIRGSLPPYFRCFSLCSRFFTMTSSAIANGTAS